MMAHWMAYCAVVGALLALGALALERALAAFGRPTRWAWAAALFLTLAVPAAARLIPDGAETAPTAVKTVAPAKYAASGEPVILPMQPRRTMDLRALDRPLLALWGASSAAALLVLASLAAVLELRRRRWRAAAVDGVSVLVSPDTGPAVVGLVKSRIVLPEWACAADEDVRALMLEHEQEHVRAGDPRLLAAGLVALAVMPWSPAVWWQLRRLRLAVEVDCDARVLRRRGDVRAYGTLLLEMGRRAGGSRLAVAAFSEPTSFLERRIRTMTEPRVRNPVLRAAGFGAVAAALAVAACETPGPVQVAPASAERVYGEGETRPKIDVRTTVARYYPDVLASGAGAGATLTFVVSPGGEIVHHALDRAQAWTGGVTATGSNVRVPPNIRPALAGKNLNPDDIAHIDVLRFAAGQMGPDPVGVVWVSMGEPGHGATGQGAEIRMPAEGSVSLSMETSGSRVRPRRDVGGSRLGELVEKHRPRGVPEGASQLVWARFTLDAQGKARGLVIEGQPHPAVGEAARKVLEEMVFLPAEEGHEMRLGLDFAQGRGRRTEMTTTTATRMPATPRETIAAALLRAYPRPTANGEYWFMANARDEVIESGTTLQAATLQRLDPSRIGALQVESLEIEGVQTKVMWIKLKGETSL